MKPIKIDFVKPAVYPWIWGVTALLLAMILIGFAWKGQSIRLQKAAVLSSTNELQAKLQALQAITNTPQAPNLDSSKQRQASQIAQRLQIDLDKPLRTLESLQIPGVRLRSLAIDNQQSSIEIELDLPSLQQLAIVSEALGTGYSKSPWVLLSTTAQNQVSTNQMVGTTTNNSAYVGRWRAKLTEL